MLSTTPASSSSSRSSVFPSFRRRHPPTHPPPEHEKFPLLTLRLSTSSFLDALVHDDVTERPLYTIKTAGPFTTVQRADPWDGVTKTAEIRWPRRSPEKGKHTSDGVVVSLRGIFWNGTDAFLRRGSNQSAPRKFNIPNYAHSLKWRRVGGLYWCETSAVKGPIAIFDPCDDAMCPRLTVYETFHDKYDHRPNLIHHGVSLLLLDYLLVTAMFLVTDIQDWVQADKFAHVDVNIAQDDHEPHIPPPFGLSPGSTAGFSSTSDIQWRKIIYGEPLYPKKSRSSFSSTSTTSDGIPNGRISADQMAKLAYGHPLYPKIRTSTPDLILSDSEENEEEDDQQSLFFSPVRTRPPSPSAESSVFDPHSTRHPAPSHNYLDPSFYGEDDVPPVPPIPAQYASSTSTRPRALGSSSSGSSGSSQPSRASVMTTEDARSSRSLSTRSRPSSSYSITSQRIRELPDLPPIPPLIPRPRSTPPRSMTSPSVSPTTQAPPLTSSDAVSSHEFQSERPPSLPPAPAGQPPQPPHQQQRKPSRQLPQPPVRLNTMASNGNLSSAVPPTPTGSVVTPLTPLLPPTMQRSRSRSQSQVDKWSSIQQQQQQRQRTLPSPPAATTSSSRLSTLPPPPTPTTAITTGYRQSPTGLVQELDQGPYLPHAHPHARTLQMKDCEDVSWLPHLPNGGLMRATSVASVVTSYDLPPPAYNSINFSSSSTAVEPQALPPPISASSSSMGSGDVCGVL